MFYKGCQWMNKKKRKERSGETYASVQRMWRMGNRFNKLLGYGKVPFKKFYEGLWIYH
jgi:hypothetical protein